MVGAIKSNRCGTCKDRKVKCDLAWPVCGPCKRSHRLCPPRPSLKVIDEGQQVTLQRLGKTLPPKAITALYANQNAHTDVFLSTNSSSPCDIWLNQQMPLSASERLSYTLIDSLSMENSSCSLKTLGRFMWWVPQRLSSSAALAGVTSCLLASHEAVVRGNRRSQINAHLYARALCNLQRAIEDPVERLSSNTLCAVLLFQRIEAVFGEIFAPIHHLSLQEWQKHGELVHASGLAALVQEKGPPKPKDKSDASVIIDSHACIIHQALVQGKVCFLASKEWAAALDNIEGRTDIQTIFYQILRQMTLWPTLLHEKKSSLYDGDLGTNLSSLLETAQRVQTAMYGIGHDLDTLIETRRVCRTIPSTCLSDLVTEMYELDDTMVGVVICYHAMYSIVVLRIIWSVTDVLQRIALEFDIFQLCKRVWMLIEHGRQCMPLGLPILQTALMMTMESVDWKAQESIVDITNELDRFHEPGQITWTRAALIKKAMVYRGDCSIYHD